MSVPVNSGCRENFYCNDHCLKEGCRHPATRKRPRLESNINAPDANEVNEGVLFDFINEDNMTTNPHSELTVSQPSIYVDLLSSGKEVHCIMPNELYAVRSVVYLDKEKKPVPYNKACDVETSTALSQYDVTSWEPPVYYFVRFIKKHTQDGRSHTIPICSCCPEIMDPLEQIALFDTSQFANGEGDYTTMFEDDDIVTDTVVLILILIFTLMLIWIKHWY